MDFENSIASLLNNLSNSVPSFIAVIIILVIGYFFAKFFQRLTSKLLKKTDLDNRLSRSVGANVNSEKVLSKLVYYLIMIFVLMAALDRLGIESVMTPLRNMTDSFLAFIPNVFAAGLIGFVGYVIANIASNLVGMAAGFIEKISQRAGLKTELDLTKILKKMVFIVVFLPLLIAALDALHLETITEPAKAMLQTFINAVPNIIAAVLIIGMFFVGGKFIAGLLGELLGSLGTDKLSERLQLSSIIGEQTSLSKLLARGLFFFVMFLGVITGVEKLGFTNLDSILMTVFNMTGSIAFGLFILVLGNYLANLTYQSMAKGTSGKFIASISRVVILGLFLAISLRTMGIADDIVNLAFGLTLGAVAVAVALSFGLGGREAAGEQMKRILNKFNQK